MIQIACALQNLKIFDKQQVDFVPQIFKRFIHYAQQNLNPTAEDIANKIFDKQQVDFVKKSISNN